MNRQLALDLPHRPALGADDFLVSECNAVAVRLIDAWPEWPGRAHVLVGPKGSGKSHLATVWMLKSGAAALAAADLERFDPSGWAPGGAALIEDADRAGLSEVALFHVLNKCREAGTDILLTGCRPPSLWPIALPDLASRLRSLPVVAIGAPDDELLRAVLLKQFADRQLDVEPRVIEYLVRRMDRSMAMTRQIVAALDQAALAGGRPITRQLAGAVLASLEGGDEAG